MTGLIEEFCRSSRRNVAKTSREAFPYLLKLLNACRAILEKNAQEWDASPREDPVYELIKKVADILVQYSKPNVKFDTQDLLKQLKDIPTSINDFATVIEGEFDKLKPIEAQKAKTFQHTKGTLKRFLKKAGSVVSSDETLYVEVVLYKKPSDGFISPAPDKSRVDSTEDLNVLTGPVLKCRPDSTVNLLLVNMLVQGDFRSEAFSLQDNPHFFRYKIEEMFRSSDPLDPLPFEEVLGGVSRGPSGPLVLYCVRDQWKYPRLLLKTVPQRAFTNLWHIGGEILIKEITGKLISARDKRMAAMYKPDSTHRITKSTQDVKPESRDIDGLSWMQLLKDMNKDSAGGEDWSMEVRALEYVSDGAETMEESVYHSAESENEDSEAFKPSVPVRPEFSRHSTSQTLVDHSAPLTQKVGSFKSKETLPLNSNEAIIRQIQPRRDDHMPEVRPVYPDNGHSNASPGRESIRPSSNISTAGSRYIPQETLSSARLASRKNLEHPSNNSIRSVQAPLKTPGRLKAGQLAPFTQDTEHRNPIDRTRHSHAKYSSGHDTSRNSRVQTDGRQDTIDNAPRNGGAGRVKENLRNERGTVVQNVSHSSIRNPSSDSAMSWRHDDSTPQAQGGKHDGTSELTNSSNVRRDDFAVESDCVPSGIRPEKRESNARTHQSTQPRVQSGRSSPPAVVQTRPGTPSHLGPQKVSNLQPSRALPNDLMGETASATRGQEPRLHSQKVDVRGPSEHSTPKSPPLPKQSMQLVDVPAQPENRADTNLVDITSARANVASITTKQTSPSTAQGSSSRGRNHRPAAEAVNTSKMAQSPVRPGTSAKGVSVDQQTSHGRSSTPTNTASREASVSRNVAALERQQRDREGKMSSVLPTIGSKSAGNDQHTPMNQDSRTTTTQPLPSPTPPAPGRRRRWYDPIVDVIWGK